MTLFMNLPFGNPFRAERIIRKGKVGEAGSRRAVDSSLLDRAAAHTQSLYISHAVRYLLSIIEQDTIEYVS